MFVGHHYILSSHLFIILHYDNRNNNWLLAGSQTMILTNN